MQLLMKKLPVVIGALLISVNCIGVDDSCLDPQGEL